MKNIGNLLKEKRLELGLTVEDVSTQTRLTQKHIKALEEGNLEFFHDDLSYLRFFVKSYCEVLDIDFENVKDELRESVNDYTQTLTMSTQMMHEEMEKNIAKSEKLSKVKSDVGKSSNVRKTHKSGNRIKKMDISLISFIAIVGVVAIVIIFGLVMYLKSGNNTDNKKVEDQPIVNKGNKDNTYPTNEEENKNKDEEKKELAITKNDVTHYTIDNTKDGDDLKFEIYFGGSNSGFSFSVDNVVLADPPSKIYNYQTTATANIKSKKDSKIVIYIGWMYDTSIKINGKNVKIDDSVIRSNGSVNLEFVITGEK